MSKFEELAFKNVEDMVLRFADEHTIELIDKTNEKTSKDDYLNSLLVRYRKRDGDLTNTYGLWKTLTCYCGKCAKQTREYFTVFEIESSDPIKVSSLADIKNENLFRIYVSYDKIDKATARKYNLWKTSENLIYGEICGYELSLEQTLPTLRKLTNPIKDKLD